MITSPENRQMHWVCQCGHAQDDYGIYAASGPVKCGGCGADATYERGRIVWAPYGYLIILEVDYGREL
jgi:hypothetical protein